MKKIFNYLLLAIITILVLFFSLKDNFNEIISTLKNMNVLWIIVAFLVMIIALLLKTIPPYFFAKGHKKGFKYKNSIILILRTQFFNAVTPFATGGQPYQIYYLNKCGIRTSTATGIIVENFIVYQIALVFLGLVALLSNFIWHYFSFNSILIKLLSLGFIINTFVIIMSFVLAFGKKITKKLMTIGIIILTKLHVVKDTEIQLKKWHESTENFHDSMIILMKDKKTFFTMILVNLLYLMCIYIIPLFILFATGDYTSLTIFKCIITSSYVMLIGSFVPIPGGTGGLEYGFIKFYGGFIKGSVLSATMLIWRFITYYFGLILGAIALNIKEKK